LRLYVGCPKMRGEVFLQQAQAGPELDGAEPQMDALSI
jgi:hypothetical protein